MTETTAPGTERRHARRRPRGDALPRASCGGCARRATGSRRSTSILEDARPLRSSTPSRHPVPAARAAGPGLRPVDRGLLGRRDGGGHGGAAHGDPAVDRRFRPAAAGGSPRRARQGKMFAGHTREIEGFLRRDFEKQKIKSFLSVPIFANGNVWGTLAINDCMRERSWTRRGKGGDGDRRAGARRRHRASASPTPMSARSSARPCCRPRSTPSS